MFGALIFGTVQIGLFYTGIDTDWFKAFVGIILLVAVVFNNFVRAQLTSVTGLRWPLQCSELENVSKNFGSVVAIENISVSVFASEVLCLLGDNGAGKSTVIKIMSGVHQPSRGVLRLEGAPRTFSSPRDARLAGIATVFQDLAVAPLMSVTRNFFMGRELVKGWGPFRQFDIRTAADIAAQGARPDGH